MKIINPMIAAGCLPKEEQVLQKVASVYNEEARKNDMNYTVSLNEIKGYDRKQFIAEARQMSAYFLRGIKQVKNPENPTDVMLKNKYSLTQVGMIIGMKDHSTVLHSAKAIEVRKNTNQLLIPNSRFDEIKNTVCDIYSTDILMDDVVYHNTTT